MTDKLTLIDTIAKNPTLSTFSRLLGTSNASEIFGTEGDFTVFAPTDDAFRKIPEAQMNELITEPGQPKLKALISYHILPGKKNAANLSSMKSTPTMAGTDVTLNDVNGLKVNGSGVQSRNVEATNGFLHTLETVLAPPAAATTTT